MSTRVVGRDTAIQVLTNDNAVLKFLRACLPLNSVSRVRADEPRAKFDAKSVTGYESWFVNRAASAAVKELTS